MILEVVLTILLVTILLIFSLTKHGGLGGRRRLPPSPWPSLPIIGHLHLLSPLIHQSFHRLSRRHSAPLLYLNLGSHPCIVASTPDLAREILKTHDLAFSDRFQTLAIRCFTYDSSLAFAPYGDYWKFARKLVTSQLLSPAVLAQQLWIRTQELTKLLGNLRDKSRGGTVRVNVTEEVMTYAYNIVSRMMFGATPDGGASGYAARKVIREVSEIAGEFNVSDFVWILKGFDVQGVGKRAGDIHKRYDEVLETIISDREEKRKERRRKGSQENEEEEVVVKDFIDMMLDIMEDDTAEIQVTRDHVEALVLDMLTAGTDTTGTTLEWALAEIINHPKVLNKAKEEIDRVVGPNRLVQESDAPNLPYIEAIIKETFRLHPTIPMINRQSSRECEISGYHIPAKTLLFVNMWSIGRDPKCWPDRTLEFYPDRFLKQTDLDDLDIKPFGSGRRICPGMPMALRQLPTALAAMIQCFDWTVESGEGCKDSINGVTLIDMNERPGLIVPRAVNLLCIPKLRVPNIIVSPDAI
ncbi:Licodione synthase [Linum grandiflorum]